MVLRGRAGGDHIDLEKGVNIAVGRGTPGSKELNVKIGVSR